MTLAAKCKIAKLTFVLSNDKRTTSIKRLLVSDVFVTIVVTHTI